jgi:hypothetical protein
MVRARPAILPEPGQEELQQGASEAFLGDFYFVAIPRVTYEALSKAALKRGMSVAQLLEQAIEKVPVDEE